MSTFDDVAAILAQFAVQYNLRIKRDECGDPIIPGPLGQIYVHSASELGVMIFPPGDPRPRFYAALKKKCLSVGMTLHQDCDAEGTLLFDPDDKEQARTAIKVIEVRPKKRISEAHKAKLLAGLQTYKNSRSGAIVEGGLTC